MPSIDINNHALYFGMTTDESTADLRLAMSYTPAILGILKSFAAFVFFQSLQQIDFYFTSCFLFTITYLDKVTYRGYLFDSNTLLGCTCLCLVVNCTRSMYGNQHSHIVIVVSDVAWMILCCFLLTKERVVSDRWRWQTILANAFLFLLHTQIYLEPETIYNSFARILCFNILSVVWMYTINHKKLRIETLETLLPCILRFAVILFASPILAYFFVLTAVTIIILQTKTKYFNQDDSTKTLLSEDIEKNSSVESETQSFCDVGETCQDEVMKNFRKALSQRK